MENLILFDDKSLIKLLRPFTYTRPIAALRVGILTIKEKWEKMMSVKGTYHSQFHLRQKFPTHFDSVNLLVNASILPDKDLCERIKNLKLNHAIVKENVVIALKFDKTGAELFLEEQIPEQSVIIDFEGELRQIKNVWDIFTENDIEIRKDFNLLIEGRKSKKLSETNQIIGPWENLFIEEGASVECSILNTNTGPVYIGKNAQVMEGSMLRGPLALCDYAVTKMGTKIYGATTLGPHCKVGGEINNSVMFGYSNKGHDGFLGNSVIGEWCNLGADTNNSNLKNNYGDIKIWDYESSSFENSGMQFCGLFMGDHSKCGINTMFNTGTVVGVSANIFGGGFPPKFIPSFSWGGAEGFSTYRPEEALDTAEKMMARRNIKLTNDDKKVFRAVFEQSAVYRIWDQNTDDD